MASFPVQVLLGLYLGLLAGIVPALVAGILGFVFKYFTDVSIPGFGVVVLALAIAGVNGGLMALSDKTITRNQNSVALVVAIVVVLMVTLYAHAQGDKLGADLPRRFTIRQLTERTLSTDVVELVGGRGQVRVTVAGDVGDVEGYPPLPTELRTEIREGEWTFPADVPLSELETRLADRLRSDYDLADVSVRLDERARATLAAAPPSGGLSKRVPAGSRAVSFTTLVPTGLARGETVRLTTPDGMIEGTVVSAKSTANRSETTTDATDSAATDGGTDSIPSNLAPPAPVADGGEGRVTIAVDRAAAVTLLEADEVTLVVTSQGTRREFELTTLLRRAGKRFRRVRVVSDGPLDGNTIGEASVLDTYDVAILAVKDERWRFAPRGETELEAGDELFTVGTREALDTFSEVAA